MQIIHNTLHLGIEKPFTFLQATDTHLTFTDDMDAPRRREFARQRGKDFPHEEDNLAFIRSYVAETGFPLVHTGDLMDFITPENLRVAEQFARDTGMLLVAGNHEQAICVNDVFCPEDYAQDLKRRDETYAWVQKYFENDTRFFLPADQRREPGGHR